MIELRTELLGRRSAGCCAFVSAYFFRLIGCPSRLYSVPCHLQVGQSRTKGTSPPAFLALRSQTTGMLVLQDGQVNAKLGRGFGMSSVLLGTKHNRVQGTYPERMMLEALPRTVWNTLRRNQTSTAAKTALTTFSSSVEKAVAIQADIRRIHPATAW